MENEQGELIVTQEEAKQKLERFGQPKRLGIESHPSAPDGLVKTLTNYNPDMFPVGAAILCRNNAPLVAFAYALLRRDIPCIVLGKDFGAALASLVKKMRATNLEDCQTRLATYFQREISKAVDEDRSPDRLYDQQDCLTFFIQSLDEDSRTVDSLLAKIDLMFGEPQDGNLSSKVILSSIHKSKGLEFGTVFILDRHLCPSKYATQPWQKQQERNLMYVAVTRSMDKLFYISSDCWKKNE